MNLYQLNDTYLSALQELAVDSETGEIIGAYNLVALEQEIDQKLLNYGKAIKMLINEQNLVSNEIDRLVNLDKNIEKKIEWLEGEIKAHYSPDRKPLKDLMCSLSYRTSQAVEIESKELLPKEFVKTKLVETVDKALIGKVIKEGKEVQGARMITRYNLQVK